MSISSLVRTGATQAFLAAGDAIELVKFIAQSESPELRVDTGEVINPNEAYDVHMLFDTYGSLFNEDFNKVVQEFDGKLIGYVLSDDGVAAAQQQVKTLKHVPRKNDIVVRGGDRLLLAGITTDPTKVLYTFILEKP